MAGTKQGGRNAGITNKKKYGEDYYKIIGRLGGKKGTTCGIVMYMSDSKPININNSYTILSSGAVLGVSGKPMRPQLDGKGYLRVQIKTPAKPNGVTTLKVHRVVAEHFLDNPLNLPQVDHLDGDKSNNDVSNLEWVTNVENQERAVARGAYLHRTPASVLEKGGQILTAILDGYVATDLYELNEVQRKTLWSCVGSGRISPKPIIDIKLGRKKKYCYFDKGRSKWRVERSDFIAIGRQFDTEREAVEYAQAGIGGGFYANRELARTVGAKGGRISKRRKANYGE